MEENNLINIEVAFATKERQEIIQLNVKPTTCVIDAIKMAEIESCFPQYDFSNMVVGIFGKRIDVSNYTLQDNDRIEIYRPLPKTPNERRLQRAKGKL